ncbi:MAG: rhodanese-like domain-containing protein [Firmicutes bacterium]|nr:rhodanese-like domain-containing protein [Bacillota bacterium]
MKKIVVILIILVLCGCNNKSNSFEYQKVNNEDMAVLMSENSYTIIDVRTNEEYELNHIKGAINIPYDELENSVLPETDIVFVYCASGRRSEIASNTLINLGYQVYDLGSIDNIDLNRE